jgi:hypothetical protein
MTVVDFYRRETPGEWRSEELRKLVSACAPALSRDEASSWEVDATEAGDPQFYLLGPAPDHHCMLCVSRLGRLYVVEDGSGGVLFESAGLLSAVERIRAALHRKGNAMVARVTLAWYAIRNAFEEKIEPVLCESEELLAHVAPQLAALA